MYTCTHTYTYRETQTHKCACICAHTHRALGLGLEHCGPNKADRCLIDLRASVQQVWSMNLRIRSPDTLLDYVDRPRAENSELLPRVVDGLLSHWDGWKCLC